jgi:hypothetical protein
MPMLLETLVALCVLPFVAHGRSQRVHFCVSIRALRLTRLRNVNFVCQSWLSKLTPNFVNQL